MNVVESVIATPPHIVFVLDHYYPHVGGAETLFDELARGLATRGLRVSVVTRQDRPEHPRFEIREEVEIHRVASPAFLGRAGFMLGALPTLNRVARDADLIHTGGYGSLAPAWCVGRMSGKPVVATIFEVMAEQMQLLANVSLPVAWGFRLVERLLLALPFSRYACISEYTRGRLLKVARVPRDKTDVVYPAVDYDFWNPERHAPRDLRAQLGLAADQRVALFFGRPGASKGIDTLVAAAESLTSHPTRPCHLVLLLAHEPRGGRQWVVDQVRERGLAARTTILDPVPRGELPSYLLAADCVVIPSLSEGFGYSAVEAATLGCRVVASSGHAVEEVVGPYVRLVPPRDPQALAEAVRDVAYSSASSTAAPARFTVPAHVDGVLAIYAEVLDSLADRFKPTTSVGSNTVVVEPAESRTTAVASVIRDTIPFPTLATSDHATSTTSTIATAEEPQR